MHLYKETFHGLGNEYYIKEYNDNGLLLFEDKGYYGFWTTKKFTYDNKNRICKINEIEIGHKENNQEDKLLHVYEYTEDNYRIITYRTHKRDIHDINTYENLVDGVEKWHDVDEAVFIKEYKFQNKNLISEKHHNIETGEKHSLYYVYADGKIISETKTNINGAIEQNKYFYKNNLLVSKDILYNNSLLSKTVYFYKDNLLKEEQKICQHNTLEYIASKIKHIYNTNDKLVKTELYERFNSKLYLCKVDETSYENNVIIHKGSAISYYEFYTGYYDLNSLNQVRYAEYESNKQETVEINGSIDFGTTVNEFTNIDELFFETAEFDNNYLTIETYDHKNNLVENKSINPKNKDEVFEHLIYHHEYNETSQLELSLCFSVSDSCEIEKRSVKRLHYRQ